MNELPRKTNDANLADEMLDFIWEILSSPSLPDEYEIPGRLLEHDKFRKTANLAFDLRKLTGALSKGDLGEFVYSKGYVLSNLKALQSNLRHLTWQTRKIADGDFSQKVDFLGEFSTSFNEMTHRLEAYSNTLKQLANFDHLTQIPNRLFLNEFLEKTFMQFASMNTPYCVMLFDLDFFKNVNDTYGHDAGDRVLYQISRLINASFRSSDVFARYGGEEFVAVLPGASIEIARAKAEQILRKVREAPFHLGDGTSIHITVSIGISQSHPDDQSCNDILKRSDEALYAAKEKGRDQAVVY